MIFKKAILLLFLLACTLMPSLAASNDFQNGENYTAPDSSLITHATAANFPMEGKNTFSVTVNNKRVGLYNDRSHWGGLVQFGSFEFVNGKEITIKITYAKTIKTYEVMPIKKLDLLSVKKTGAKTIEIKTNRADQNITVVVNGEYKKDALHLFCNSVDRNAPNVPDRNGFHKFEKEKVYYFGPGYYDMEKILNRDILVLDNGWKVYLAGGAVLYGRIGLWGTEKGTKVHGRGMVYNDTRNARVIFEANDCNGADVEGVLFHCHRAGVWQVVINHCKNVEFKGVKILSTRYASTDGLDVVNCQQCAFLNTFIRANDDAIAIKGLDSRKPAECPPTRNITFCGMQLWNDCNCAMGIGAENHCQLYENIKFMNSSILFSYDDPDYHEVLDERAAMTICCIHGTYFRNISYENIDVYHCERLIAAGFQPSFWFGSLPGDQTTPGGIEGLVYRNINCLNNSGSSIANQMYLYGWNKEGTPAKSVNNVVFEDVNIEGLKVRDLGNRHFKLGANIENVQFK